MTVREQLAADIDRARSPLVERIGESVAENGFTGIVGEAESGKSYSVLRAGANLARDGWKFVRLDLEDAYSPNQLAWTWARQLARVVADPIAFSHIDALDPSMWPSATRGEFLTLPQRIGDEAARLIQQPYPEGSVGSIDQLSSLAHATADLAQQSGRVTLVVDHLEAQETGRRKSPGARELLWTIRAAAQREPELHVVLICRPAAQDLATDHNAAYHLDGRWLTVPSLNPADLPGALNRKEAATVIGATHGHPAATHELVLEMLTGESSAASPDRRGVALQTALGRLADRHASLARRYLQHARTLHRLGGHLLQVVARGEGPYTGSPGIDPSLVAEAMKRLDLAGLVAKPDRRSTEWLIADPRVTWALGNQPAWIVPAPVRAWRGSHMAASRGGRADLEDEIDAALARWSATSGPLEPLQRELLKHVMEGATNEEIAEQLSVSRATVTRWLRRLYDMLDASDRQEAVQRVRVLSSPED